MIAPPKDSRALPQGKHSYWWRRWFFPTASLILLALNSLLFALRPASAAAWTLFPIWLYVLPGLALATLSGPGGKAGRKYRFWLYVPWLFSIVILADEPRGLFRLLLPHSKAQTLRVISLNCAVGREEAAAEVIAHNPHIVLLQETPSKAAVANLARSLWGQNGEYVWGVEASILANGDVKPIALPEDINIFATAARVTINNRSITVASFRLTTPPFRVELWSPEVWHVQAKHHQIQRRQLRSLRALLDTLPHNNFIIAGGDCNVPGGDGVFREWQPLLHDAYYESGRGWGNTFMSEFPVLRIDQIWIGRNFQAAQLIAQRTRYSDHRMVICDFKSKK